MTQDAKGKKGDVRTLLLSARVQISSTGIRVEGGVEGESSQAGVLAMVGFLQRMQAQLLAQMSEKEDE